MSSTDLNRTTGVYFVLVCGLTTAGVDMTSAEKVPTRLRKIDLDNDSIFFGDVFTDPSS